MSIDCRRVLSVGQDTPDDFRHGDHSTSRKAPLRAPPRLDSTLHVVAPRTGEAAPLSLPAWAGVLVLLMAVGQGASVAFVRRQGEGMAWGTKFAIASVSSPMSGHRVVLGVEHVPPRSGGGEAGRFVELMVDLADRAPGVSAFVADGALRGTHIARVQRRLVAP